MLLALLLAVRSASAADYYLESPPVAEREDAARLEAKAEASGFSARVVRRFRLGHGWEFVVLVEKLPTEAEATAAAKKLSVDLAVPLSVYVVEGAAKAVAVPEAETAPEAPAVTASQWLARADAALGSGGGGASELARAPAVHFVFERTFRLGDKDVTVRQDYWREGPNRRLSVETRGAGQDSVAIVTSTGAWISVGGAPTARDIGVAVEAVDSFAPESILTFAVEGHHMLSSPSVQRFTVLEGAESGIRLGTGSADADEGLTWLDLDPVTLHIARARYVSEGGPLEWEMRDWRKVGTAVLVPFDVRLTRATGAGERVRVEKLEVVAHAPADTFKPPVSSSR